MDNIIEESGSLAPTPPTMYRWVSTTKVPPVAGSDEPRMLLSFSVPVAVLPQPQDEAAQETAPARPPPLQAPCDVEGCGAMRKYRLVKDWQRGACGMAHLKVLEAQ